MAQLDWSEYPAVESVPGTRSGAWVFKGTRTLTAHHTVTDIVTDGPPAEAQGCRRRRP